MKGVFRVAVLSMGAIVLAQCAHAKARPNSAVLAAISSALTYQYHECVPLGWAPVPTAGSFVPGYDITELTYEEVFDAAWRGSVATRDLRNPTVSRIAQILDRLVAVGLATREVRLGRIHYGLTHEGLKYFFSSDRYGNNHGSLPYLCYSTIVPTRLLWMHKAHQWYTLSFAWKAGAPALWAANPVIRSHSVVLAPLRSPTTARLRYSDGLWHLMNVYERGWMLPELADASAWSSARAVSLKR